MKPFGWQWLAVSSAALALSLALSTLADAETRPQYGGTLHVAVRVAPSSLDPADRTQADSPSRRSVMQLIFETLVRSDDGGRIRPGLAISWQAGPGSQRWQFRLRRGVQFDDGTALTSEIAASSLRAANSGWNVLAESDAVVVECGAPCPDLPAELALSVNSIVKRGADARLSGTGPFHIAEWVPGKKLSLAAEDHYWNGRPFLDGVEIEMGRSFHDQLAALELGRADLVEVAPEQAHRVSLEGRHLASSNPIELVALLFAHAPATPEEKLLREALALSIDRASIRSVLLQGAGQATAAILPGWMSGYDFVFSTAPDLPRARHEREQVRVAPAWTISYDATDSISRLLVDRIALNARDTGLKLQPVTTAGADIQLARISLPAADAWISLAGIASNAGLAKPPASSGSPEELYLAEQSALASQRLIPLFHLPATYAASPAVKNWSVRADGNWSLADVWLVNERLASAKP